MELKDFIKDTISSISEAIIESQSDLKEKGVIVNPEKTEVGKNGEKRLRGNGFRYIQNLDFDIIIAIDEKQGAKGEGKLKVAGLLNIGGGGSSENLTKNHNRLKFTIPVAFSTTTTPSEYKNKIKGEVIHY